MNYRNPQLLNEVAAQYVLGTLRGPARRRFERLCQQSPDAMNALHRWEDRLVGMMNSVAPVAPPQAVWKKVRQRLQFESRATSENPIAVWLVSLLLDWFSRSRAAIPAGIASIILAFAIVAYLSIPPMQFIATVANEQQTELWRIDAVKDRAKLSITRSASSALATTRDYELWALPDSGAAPVSLGLMPKSGKRDLHLNTAQRLALAAASKIAISLEPIGGSPTGAPTGPILFFANVATKISSATSILKPTLRI